MLNIFQTQLAEKAAAQKGERHKSGKKKRSGVMDDSVISISSELSDLLQFEDNILSEENTAKRKSVIPSASLQVHKCKMSYSYYVIRKLSQCIGTARKTVLLNKFKNNKDQSEVDQIFYHVIL